MNPVPASNVFLHEAERVPGPDGAVEWWEPPISDEAAVKRLQAGNDIVIRGIDRKMNRNKARELMVAAYGGFVEDPSHQGRMALPRFHPPSRSPEGVHAFFETPPRHARKRKP